MSGPIHNKVKRYLAAAENGYYRLVLLVGESGSGKTAVLKNIADEFGVSVVNANLALSSALLELTAKQRTLRLPIILNEIAETPSDLVILDNLEILFDTDLQQDPLRLLQGLSRNKTVLASWGGSTSSGKLFYAQIGHPEYRSYESVDALIIDIKNSPSELG